LTVLINTIGYHCDIAAIRGTIWTYTILQKPHPLKNFTNILLNLAPKTVIYTENMLHLIIYQAKRRWLW